MLPGEKDDNLPVAKVESYLANACTTGNPAPIETVIYRGAYHAWTIPRLGTLRFYPEYVSTKNVRSFCSGQIDRCSSSMVKQSRSIQAPSVRALVKLQDIQWHMMQRFERNRLLMRCGFLSDISNHSVPSTSLGFIQRSSFAWYTRCDDIFCFSLRPIVAGSGRSGSISHHQPAC